MKKIPTAIKPKTTKICFSLGMLHEDHSLSLTQDEIDVIVILDDSSDDNVIVIHDKNNDDPIYEIRTQTDLLCTRDTTSQ